MLNKQKTFFIAPIIPFKVYLTIQKVYKKKLVEFNKQEKALLDRPSTFFDYSREISEENIKLIIQIVNKISNLPSKEFENLKDKLIFTTQNTYREITNYNKIFYDKLIKMGYKQIFNPYKIDEIDVCIGLSDIGPVSDINIQKFNEIDDEQKDVFIESLIKNLEIKSKKISQDIMSKCRIDSKINTITRILSNKSILYSMLKDEDFIPYSVSFDNESSETRESINNSENNEFINKLSELIDEYKNRSKSKYFVIKPSAGTLSDGIAILPNEDLTPEFVIRWINDQNNNKYAITVGETKKYFNWILSEFVQSFLWKLQGQNNLTKVFPNIENITENSNIVFNDKIGRINKFRFWAIWKIKNGKLESYLYKDGYCEIALEELTNYSKTQLDPANIETFYTDLFGISEDYNEFEEIQRMYLLNKIGDSTQLSNEQQLLEAATIGTYLDYGKVVTDDNYPLGKDAWNNILIPQMVQLVNKLKDTCKNYLSCLNRYSYKKDKGCFSYFALDIIIDENSKPWLLEANSRPFIGFGDYWKRYDPNYEHCINVEQFIESILNINLDSKTFYSEQELENMKLNLDKFILTSENQISSYNKVFVPNTLALGNSSTNKVYREYYKLLNAKKFSQFPYPRYINESKKSIGFRGMSPITKYLLSRINDNLTKNEYLSLVKKLFPNDAKMNYLNRISTLGYYLGDKTAMTKYIKENIKDWNTVIPYTEIINEDEISKDKRDKLIEKLDNIKEKNNAETLIAKPAYGQQGKGIIISTESYEIVDEIFAVDKTDWVISKYLDNPYLIKLNNSQFKDTTGRKSHMRAYVLLHKQNKKLNVYLCKYSLLFCAVKEYGTCNNENDEFKKFCNLTNLYFGSLYYKEYLNKDPSEAYKDLSVITSSYFSTSQYDSLMKKVVKIITKTIHSVKSELNCLNEPNDCFQYIAFDLHLEYGTKNEPVPWLLEVNATPGLKAPMYQFEKVGHSLNSFLESILEIVVDDYKVTKKRSNRNMFEKLPMLKK